MKKVNYHLFDDEVELFRIIDTTQAQQKALDDALVAPDNRLNIRNCNLRLSSTLKSKEPTLQVVLDALKLTPFFKAFEITADVLEIYMKEFWATNYIHHSSLRFKMNSKSHTMTLKTSETCSRFSLNSQAINLKILHLKRKFSLEKLLALESLCLSRAQILCGMYHNKHVDYVYLLWEDLVYQVNNKNSKKNNDMYYPPFSKSCKTSLNDKRSVNSKEKQDVLAYCQGDSMFTTIRVISKHQDTQIYGAILPRHLTNQDMIESEAYKTYYAYATGEKTPKPKYVKKKVDSDTTPKKMIR
ncbi:hypothetical protein Tco_1410013 [Tanacetum coccineum]